MALGIFLALCLVAGCAAERVPGQRTDVSLHDARTFCALEGLRYARANGWSEGDGPIATLMIMAASPAFRQSQVLVRDCMTAMGWRDL